MSVDAYKKKLVEYLFTAKESTFAETMYKIGATDYNEFSMAVDALCSIGTIDAEGESLRFVTEEEKAEREEESKRRLAKRVELVTSIRRKWLENMRENMLEDLKRKFVEDGNDEDDFNENDHAFDIDETMYNKRKFFDNFFDEHNGEDGDEDEDDADYLYDDEDEDDDADYLYDDEDDDDDDYLCEGDYDDRDYDDEPRWPEDTTGLFKEMRWDYYWRIEKKFNEELSREFPDIELLLRLKSTLDELTQELNPDTKQCDPKSSDDDQDDGDE